MAAVSRFELYLDSASLDDAKAAAELGYVVGITTNPTLLAREGRPALEQIRALVDAFPGRVFHQPVSVTPAESEEEIRRMAEVSEGRLVGKLPALPDLFAVAGRLITDGIPCAMTAVYSPAQALVAAATRLGWVIPYVNRAARLRENGSALVSDLRECLAGFDDRPLILAASIKSAHEAVASVLDGADAVSAPLAILRSFLDDDLTAAAVETFARDAADAGIG